MCGKKENKESQTILFNYYDHAINGIVSTSKNILRRFIFTGLLFSIFIFMLIIYQIINFLFFDRILIPPDFNNFVCTQLY